MIRDLFYLQKSDRRVIIALLCVIVVAMSIIFLTGEQQEKNASHSDSVAEMTHKKGGRQPYFAVPTCEAERFYFDPNTADSTQLLRLGLQSWQVRNIYKYRAKGGIYRRPEDFARLYGLTVKQYRELEPFIRISADYQPAATLVKERRQPAIVECDSFRRAYPPKISEAESVVLNTADTALLQRVPGIGPYFARQIIRYGERLGGYVSVDQLDEIEDFPDDAKHYLIVENPNPRKLNLNKLSLQELRRHPYIDYYQAKTIVDYRRLHGSISSLDELRLSKDFTQEAIQRLKPYVEY